MKKKESANIRYRYQSRLLNHSKKAMNQFFLGCSNSSFLISLSRYSSYGKFLSLISNLLLYCWN